MRTALFPASGAPSLIDECRERSIDLLRGNTVAAGVLAAAALEDDLPLFD